MTCPTYPRLQLLPEPCLADRACSTYRIRLDVAFIASASKNRWRWYVS